jgi:hypothetical protein
MLVNYGIEYCISDCFNPVVTVWRLPLSFVTPNQMVLDAWEYD